MILGIENTLDIIRKIPINQTWAKYKLVDITFSFIGAAFEEVSKLSKEFKEEISDWNDERRIGIGVLPKGPYITLEKKRDQVFVVGKGLYSTEVVFLFKNLDSAVMVFTAQMSSHQAVSECRILVDGNNAYAMELNRALSIVQKYLFPQFILNMIFKRPPVLTKRQLIIKARVYAALLPALYRLRNKLKSIY